jgi:hypothetical protein
LKADWVEALECCNAVGKFLHMKYFVHGTTGTDWEGWTEAERVPLLKKLVPALHAHVTLSLCGSIPVQAFASTYRPQDFLDPDDRLHPYELLLQGAMEAIADLVGPSKASVVTLFVESNQAQEANAITHFYNLVGQRPGWADLFPSITPQAKGPIPLQAADMIAYEGSRYSSGQVLGTCERQPRTLYLELARSAKFVFTTASRELLARHRSDLFAAGAAAQVTPELAAHVNRAFSKARKQMQRERSTIRIGPGGSTQSK